jgi:hypothetical protein
VPKLVNLLFFLGLLASCGAPPEGEGEGEGPVGTQTAGVCPTSEPTTGAACDGAVACVYPACGRDNGSIWGCESGAWKQVIIPGCE